MLTKCVSCVARNTQRTQALDGIVRLMSAPSSDGRLPTDGFRRMASDGWLPPPTGGFRRAVSDGQGVCKVSDGRLPTDGFRETISDGRATDGIRRRLPTTDSDDDLTMLYASCN